MMNACDMLQAHIFSIGEFIENTGSDLFLETPLCINTKKG